MRRPIYAFSFLKNSVILKTVLVRVLHLFNSRVMVMSGFYRYRHVLGLALVTAISFSVLPVAAVAQSEAQEAQGEEKSEATQAPSQDDLSEPDVFYDSTDLAPGATPTQSTAPIKMDPREQPGQSFIIVKKNRAAGSYESQVVAANRALKLGRDAAALEMFEGLYKRNPRDVRVLMGLAVAQQRSGFSASAIETYEDVLKRDPHNQEAVVNMLGLMKNQYPEVALRRLTDLRKKYPNNPGIAAQIGMTQADLGRYDDALRYLDVAASLEPNNAAHVFNMAILYDRKGRKSDAITMYEEALKLDAIHGASRSIPRETVYDRLSSLRRM